jgi:Rieske Fe-S protein
MMGFEGGSDRRSVLAWASRLLMAGGLIGAYGTLAAFMGRFLYPARPPTRGWMFVIETARLPAGESIVYETPGRATVNIAHKGKADGTEDFIALSSVCPHLGCQVHWETHNSRFFCPCHNGVFDPSGKATAGPPAEAGQSLPRYPLKVEAGLLYIEVPLEQLAQGRGRVLAHRGAGRPSSGPGPNAASRGNRMA